MIALLFLLTLPARAADKLVIGDTFTIESKILRETRRINVYRPPGDGPMPVLYMPDGGMAEDFLHIAGLVQIGVANGTMRPFLLVGIENTERRRDMTGPTENAEDRKIAPRVGGSAAFRAFLRQELMPAVRARYRTTNETAIAGESLAGLFVMETFFVEPDLFDTYIAIDPSLWWNDRKLIADPALPKNKTLWFATSEEKSTAEPAQALAAMLTKSAPATLRWHYEPMPYEKHATIYHPAALKAFREVLR